MFSVDVFVLGAGAAGLMCAIEAGKRGRSVVVIDHARLAGEKIRISGGGRCNFTNLHTTPANFLSANPRFAISALARYTSQDFVAMVKRHGIAYHEKTQGQLFCDGQSQEIINMLLAECSQAGATIRTQVKFSAIAREGNVFLIETTAGVFQAQSVVVASGGLSIPKMGASGVGYEIAEQFGIAIAPTRPALVPLTFSDDERGKWAELAGVSFPSNVKCGRQGFHDASLFTHRGLSGPAILQISSYWAPTEIVTLNLAPNAAVADVLQQKKRENPQQELATAIAEIVPRRLAQTLAHEYVNGEAPCRLGALSDRTLRRLGEQMNAWTLKPAGTEGYRIAEVTAGGVDTRELSSQTMESKKAPGLFFIGEVVDVTGHLGGFNFQWAWASGYAAGQAV